MKYYAIDKRIDEELVKDFLKFVNENQTDAWTIVLFTVGGMRGFGNVITHAINKHKYKVDIIAISAYSSGFDIFYQAKASKKYVFDNTLGMVHMVSAHMRMNSDGSPTYLEDMGIKKSWKEINPDCFTQFLTRKELKLYKNGQEVYFTARRIMQLMPDVEML